MSAQEILARLLHEHIGQYSHTWAGSSMEGPAEEILAALRESGFDVLPEQRLDTAWREVEDVLPNGWWIERLERSGTDFEFTGGRREYVDWWEAWARGPKDAEQRGAGPGPASALGSLRAVLQKATAGVSGAKR